MNTKIYLVVFGLSLFGVGLWAETEEVRPEPLKLFLVFSEERPGTSHFSTEEFPDLGFVGPEPDLVFQEFESVAARFRTDEVVTLNPYSGERDEEHVPQRSVLVELNEHDAEKFASFTHFIAKDYRGARVLMLVGEEAVAAPTVHVAIAGGSFEIVVASRDKAEAIAERLKGAGRSDEQGGESTSGRIVDAWRETSASAEAYAIVDLLGWLDFFANIPYIHNWEGLSVMEREKFEKNSKYNLQELRHLIAVWIDGEFPVERREPILNFLDSNAGRTFWKSLRDQAQSGGLRQEDLVGWLEKGHSERLVVFMNEFSEDHQNDIMTFFQSEAGIAFWKMLLESHEPDWAFFAKVGDWLAQRHRARWDFLGLD